MKYKTRVIWTAYRDHLSLLSILFISSSLVFCSFICSFYIKNADIFASSGALVAIAGIYLSFSHTINLVPKNETKLMAHKLALMRLWPTKGTDEYNNMLKEAKKILTNERIGFVMSMTGTSIWAYGGYLKFL